MRRDTCTGNLPPVPSWKEAVRNRSACAEVGVRRSVVRSLVLVLLVFQAACTPDNASPEFAVPAGSYRRAFETSESVLREFRFNLARVDARAGVISSQAKNTSGLATPWDVEQSTLGQEFEDLVSNHSRRVRITFERSGGRASQSSPAGTTVESASGGGEQAAGGGEGGAASDSAPAGTFENAPLVGRVDVVLIRTYARNWRPSSASILDSSYAYDPMLSQSGQSQVYEAPLTRDERLAARIAERIRARLSREATQAP